jgi:predicted acylesterase/phospholipase RssA
MPNKQRPKIGLALAGASSRSVFYVGFLEVLQENGFEIDYISAMSGGAVIAAAYVCGTLPEAKKLVLGMNKEIVFSLIEKSKGKGGLYHLEKVEEIIRHYTKNLRFEDVSPRLGVVATDLTKGEPVVLEIGDIAKAVCASCTLPFIFEPAQWGNKLLVDGGIVSVVPGMACRAAGMDIVFGLNLRAQRYVFSSWQIAASRIINFIKRILLFDQAAQLWQGLVSKLDFLGTYSPLVDDAMLGRPGIFSVLGRSVDLAIAAQRKSDPRTTSYDCDMLIVPDIHIPFWKYQLLFHFTDFSNVGKMYQMGRDTAEEYLPKMQKLIDNYDEPRRG